ncbi:MAG TPA: UDP-glucose--hexose-1-phosphate uridylyltransferase [Anaerolineales bacterium]|nr:UDP-glucose--hexose-1-phosphate uridylyltransferase [Anaerolineales bacterium]HLO28126.1 UDP-glucose--hexose-1-phosphate uridylyltransferase [Anaerolineales bacterium]
MTFDAPHRRFNPLTGEWVLVSPHRAKRPWLGQVEKTPLENLPPYDPNCYLCPGNERAGGLKNPDYSSTFVFDNDFPALLPEKTPAHVSNHPLLASVSERGLCRVVCFSPRHDLTLPELELPAIENIILTWREQTGELSAREFIRYVQVFENKGALMGCSNPHPHSQIWATEHIPNEPAKELEHQKSYFAEHGRTLLSDYLSEEDQHSERIIFQNDSFTALVPFWAVWPFEVLLVAHRPCAYLTELDAGEVHDMAEAIQEITTRYDNLFEISFPYSMGFHQAPFDGQSHPEWVLHAHFYPPLLRSATVRKFLVGFELLAMPQRDLTPESSAERLRSLPNTHYKLK